MSQFNASIWVAQGMGSLPSAGLGNHFAGLCACVCVTRFDVVLSCRLSVNLVHGYLKFSSVEAVSMAYKHLQSLSHLAATNNHLSGNLPHNSVKSS